MALPQSLAQNDANRLGEAIRSGKIPTLATKKKLEKVLKEKIALQMRFDSLMHEAAA